MLEIDLQVTQGCTILSSSLIETVPQFLLECQSDKFLLYKL